MNNLRILVLWNVSFLFLRVCCLNCRQYSQKKIKSKFQRLAAEPRNQLQWKIMKGRSGFSHSHDHDGSHHHHHHDYQLLYPERRFFFDIQANRVNQENRNNPNFCQELNFLATLTFEEIQLNYMGLRPYGIGGPVPPVPTLPPLPSSRLSTNVLKWIRQLVGGKRRRRTKRQLPDNIDHRDSTGPVEDQNPCGSCWAFAASHALTGVLHKAGYPLVDYSEQQLVDCVYPHDSCFKPNAGGYSSDAYEYLTKNSFIKESKYQYTASKGQCRSAASFNSMVTGWKYVSGCGWDPRTCASEIKKVVAKHPIVIYMNFNQHAFALYDKGVFDNTACFPTLPNHAMVVVGYGSGAEGDYWIVKNSWGKKYGMRGYYKIRRGINLCGIESFALYPLVKQSKVDCKVTKWGSWSRCTKTCGGGERRRKRRVIRNPSGGGKSCPGLTGTKKCNRRRCPEETTPIGSAPLGLSLWEIKLFRAGGH